MNNRIPTYLMLLFIAIGYTQQIERQVIGTAGETISNGNIILDFTVGETVVGDVSNESISLSQGFHNSFISLGIRINPVVFLQGALLSPRTSEENLMRDDLRQLYLPTISPYTDALTCDIFTFLDGGASGTGALSDNIVDWIYVELRDKNDNTNVITGRSALLQRDGDIVDVDGISVMTIDANVDDYYVAIRHRNHLGIMTATTVSLSTTTLTLDFTDANNEITWGQHAQTVNGVPSGDIAMWAGDSNEDGQIVYAGSFSDVNKVRDQVFNDPDNSIFGGPPIATYASKGYHDTDVDLNGFSKYAGASSDVNQIRDNILNNPANSIFGGPPIATYKFVQRLPEGTNN